MQHGPELPLQEGALPRCRLGGSAAPQPATACAGAAPLRALLPGPPAAPAARATSWACASSWASSSASGGAGPPSWAAKPRGAPAVRCRSCCLRVRHGAQPPAANAGRADVTRLQGPVQCAVHLPGGVQAHAQGACQRDVQVGTAVAGAAPAQPVDSVHCPVLPCPAPPCPAPACPGRSLPAPAAPPRLLPTTLLCCPALSQAVGLLLCPHAQRPAHELCAAHGEAHGAAAPVLSIRCVASCAPRAWGPLGSLLSSAPTQFLPPPGPARRSSSSLSTSWQVRHCGTRPPTMAAACATPRHAHAPRPWPAAAGRTASPPQGPSPDVLRPERAHAALPTLLQACGTTPPPSSACTAHACCPSWWPRCDAVGACPPRRAACWRREHALCCSWTPLLLQFFT